MDSEPSELTSLVINEFINDEASARTLMNENSELPAKIFSPHLQMGTWKKLWIHIMSEAAVHVVPIYWFVLYWLFNTRLHCFLFCDILWLNIDWDIIHLNSALTTHNLHTTATLSHLLSPQLPLVTIISCVVAWILLSFIILFSGPHY